MAPVHEMGHCYLAQLFEGNGPGTSSYCKNQTPPPTCGHGLHSVEYDKVATMEGWANYVAIRAWWDPENQASAPCWANNEIETGPPVHHDAGDTCADNRGIEIMVTQGYWDLDDAHYDCASAPAPTMCDALNLNSRYDIASNWTHFADGTSNRQEEENDYDGTNIYDYWVNGAGYWDSQSQVYDVMLTMTCQTGMDKY